ncbi:MAG: hypothetical protein IT483_15290 [Gammaproteobacteria bacterium]|nr:hypothetical protein [Gammaproteobacteria bacterium]
MTPDLSTSGGTSRLLLGCLAYMVVFAAIAWLLERRFGPQLLAAARPWLTLAATLLLTLGLATLYGLVTGHGGVGSREQLLARAATGQLPDADGLIVGSGRVRATGPTLRSPITGTECVAYLYRMYFVVRPESFRREQIPVYWGIASTPFVLDTASVAIPVHAVPQIDGAHPRLDSALHQQRLRDYLATTQPIEATGLLGAVASAGDIFGDLSTVRSPYRRDWKHSGGDRDPGTLLVEELVLPVGATVSVSGQWSVTQRAIVPPGGGLAGARTIAVVGPPEALSVNASALPVSRGGTVAWAVALLGLGVAVLVAGLRLLPAAAP